MELIIIGTNPPCPRCDKTYLMAEEIVKESGAECIIRQLELNTEEAKAIADSLGHHIGTTREITELTGETVDRKLFADAVLRASERTGEDPRPADLWIPDFDKALDNVVKAAEKVGYYVTPVILKDGELVWHGSVPAEEDLKRWIKGNI